MIAPKWSDMPKVDPYCYSGECYTESFRIICSYADLVLGKGGASRSMRGV